MVNWKSNKLEDILHFLIGVNLVILLNLFINKVPLRFDLTEEKRYTISQFSRNFLRNIEDRVFIEVFLTGELPSGFKRLKNATEDVLKQLRVYSDYKIDYKFTDPSFAKNDRAKNQYYRYLAEQGIQPTNLSFKERGTTKEKLIFPGATVSYFGSEEGIMLLKGNRGASPNEILNQSIENLEYEIVSKIVDLSRDVRKKIGYLSGHDELKGKEIAAFKALLRERYDLFEIKASEDLIKFDAVVVGKPTQKFSKKDKYYLDQYVMRGGKILFFVDALQVKMSDASGEGTAAVPYELNLNDLLFNYGVRINRDFVQDVNCGNYPVVAGNIGNQPQIRLLPWPFFPVVNNFGNHPAVKNLDVIQMKFVSSIDTVKAEGILKTPLLFTSPYSKILKAPVMVSFNSLQKDLDPQKYDQEKIPVGYLLEGKFESLFKNRILPKGLKNSGFKEIGPETKIVVISDGDIIRSEIDPENDQPLDIGVDPFQKITYGNKDFINKVIAYLLDDQDMMMARNKEVVLRPLDKVKVEQERTKWQVINLAAPLLLILFFMTIIFYLRKKKYTQ